MFVYILCLQIVESSTEVNWPLQAYEVLLVLLLTPFCLVRQLQYLAPISLLGNVLMLVGLVIILHNCITHLQPIDSVPAVTSPKDVALFFGAVLFSMEGIPTVRLLH